MTNRERMAGMTDEELAQILSHVMFCPPVCDRRKLGRACTYSACAGENRESCWVRFLRGEAKP